SRRLAGKSVVGRHSSSRVASGSRPRLKCPSSPARPRVDGPRFFVALEKGNDGRPGGYPVSRRPPNRAKETSMRRRVAVLVAVLGGIVPLQVGAQATGMPSYNAPYRAFQRSELGAVFSFPDGGGTGFEGMYRYARGTLDIGLRGGIFDPSGAGKAVLLVGVEARERV